MKLVPVSVAMIILCKEGHFLMQLRDEKEGILYPGQWGLFGGHLESEELPRDGLVREIKEELNYTVENPILFRCYGDSNVTRHIFVSDLDTDISSLELNEGWDLDLVPLSSIRLGRHYSSKAREERYLGNIHQRILLDFALFAHHNLS